MDKFYAKILLFGEYSILTGSNALAIPFHKYSGQLVIPQKTENVDQQYSNRTLEKYFKYLKYEKRIHEIVNFDFHRFEGDLNEGLYFDSSIPVHYGLGSSGALVAAIFKEYGDTDLNSFSLRKLRDLLAIAESFFHGRSSGIDPLTIYVSTPLLIFNNAIHEVERQIYHKITGRFYLYNSGIAAATENYVEGFGNKLSNKIYAYHYEKDYKKLIDDTIIKIANDGPEKMSDEIKMISELQLKLFSEMIPESIVPFWEKGIRSGEYSMKLCGSGGGGYFLVYSQLPLKKLNLNFDHTLESI
jgi:mevalonate kinase